MATSEWLEVGVWWLAFAGSHLALSSLPVRGRLVPRLGERGFQAAYSLVALVTVIGFVGAWWDARHAGPLLWMWRDIAPVSWAAIALGLLGFAFIFGAIFQPSPAGLAPGAPLRARGLSRITRHGFFVGVALWGVGHLLVNGWASDLVFFGGLSLFVVLGALHQDHRKRVTDGERLAPFLAETSLVPFAAVLAGRQRVVWGELPWRAIALGLAGGWVLYWFHPQLFAG